ncbi:MAG: single-stranded-DNA-specific exonuclease RecJ [Acidobacteriota bacterium]
MSSTSITVGRGLSGTRWSLDSPDESALRSLIAATGEEELLVRCLLNRGITTPDEVARFLAPDFFGHSHDPRLMRDMQTAVERIRLAIEKRERILIVTDFDVDGTTSSVILSTVIRILGGGDLVSQYIPDRFTEGYGLSTEIVERAAANGVGLIVTADIGIKSHNEASLARRLGVDLIICDHHLPDGEDVPADAYAVLCPKGSSGTDYPNKDLAACGVALKFADALLEGSSRRPRMLESFAKLTAIGSIADMVDISTSENRAIVSHGLRELGIPGPNHGLQALLDIAKVRGAPTTYDVGFKIGPRINAAGRIEHANLVLDLFNAPDRAIADKLAGELDALNSERQRVQRELVNQLFESAAAAAARDRVLVFAGRETDGFHRGVVGIACSKIVEEFGRPTLICAINDEGMGHGSARSIAGFHIVEALDSVSSILKKYGGHPMAAGFTISADQVDEFRLRLNEYAAERLSDEDLGKRITLDAELPIERVGLDLIRSLERLKPHGIGNREPLFYLNRVPLRSTKVLSEKHLKFVLGSGRIFVEALWWNQAEHYEKFATAQTISLVGRIETNVWQNTERPQLIVRDAIPGEVEPQPSS